MPPATLKLEQKDRYTREYLETLDRIDNLRVELKEEMKERKGEIATLEKAAFRLRRLLAGRAEEQTEIPGAEIPQVAPRKGVTSMTVSVGGREVSKIEGTPGEIVDRLERAGRGRGKRGSP
jgi:hypothetical protein